VGGDHRHAWLELTILGLLAVWNLCTYAFVWMAVTPGLGFWHAMVMTQATTAVANTVPGGSAIGIGMTYSMVGSWGYSRSRTTTAVLVSGVWNSFIKLGLPVLVLALVLLQGGTGGGRVIAALLGIAGLVFALMLRFADRVVVIHQGRVLTDGPPAAIKALVARGVR
jgi:putative heme transporter